MFAARPCGAVISICLCRHCQHLSCKVAMTASFNALLLKSTRSPATTPVSAEGRFTATTLRQQLSGADTASATLLALQLSPAIPALQLSALPVNACQFGTDASIPSRGCVDMGGAADRCWQNACDFLGTSAVLQHSKPCDSLPYSCLGKSPAAYALASGVLGVCVSLTTWLLAAIPLRRVLLACIPAAE